MAPDRSGPPARHIPTQCTSNSTGRLRGSGAPYAAICAARASLNTHLALFFTARELKAVPPPREALGSSAAPPQGCPIRFFAPRAAPPTAAAVSKRSARREFAPGQRFTIVRSYWPWNAPGPPFLLKNCLNARVRARPLPDLCRYDARAVRTGVVHNAWTLYLACPPHLVTKPACTYLSMRAS